MNNPTRILVSLMASTIGAMWFCMVAWQWASIYKHANCNYSQTPIGLCNSVRLFDFMMFSGLALVPIGLMIGVLAAFVYRALNYNWYARPWQITLGCGVLVMPAIMGTIVFIAYASEWPKPLVISHAALQLLYLGLNIGAIAAAALLWRMKDLGRKVAIAVLVLSTVLFLWQSVPQFEQWLQMPLGRVFFILFIPVLKIIFLLYLAMPRTRAAFIAQTG